MNGDLSLADTILLLGSSDERLQKLLKKLGYHLVVSTNAQGLPDLITQHIIDLVMIDGGEEESVSLCEFLRSEKRTKDAPIIFLVQKDEQKTELTDKRLSKITLVDPPHSAGSLVSKVATELRLRKASGADEELASVAEMNAALRNLTLRLKKDLDDARKIQQALLPEVLPTHPEYELATFYEPLEEVGGDWFFAWSTPSGKLSVQIADVTGHGLSAAFIGSMTKLALTASSQEDPGELLSSMNRLMAPQMPAGKFVTMFSYLYDPNSGELRYARAGHPPGILVKYSSGEVSHLRGDGFAVGFFEESEYQVHGELLEVNDILVVLTDALPESQNMSGELYDYQRMSQVLLNAGPGCSAQGALSILIEDFEQFREGRILKDDVTLIALKRTA